MSAAAAEFHVSPDGDDRNDGSAAKPVKTLQRALDLTRWIEREEDKEIVIKDDYPFEKPVTGLKVAFNASIWVEDQRELKSVFAVDGENFATGTLEFVKKARK